MLIQWSPHFVLHCANHCNSCKKILESHKDKRNMARIPTCFLLLPKRVSSGESGSLVSASPLIKGESQEYSRTLFRKLCSRCEQYWLPSHSSGSFNMRIINYQVCSHTGYVSSSKHFSSHTACNTLNSYCVLPPLSFFFLCAPF